MYTKFHQNPSSGFGEEVQNVKITSLFCLFGNLKKFIKIPKIKIFEKFFLYIVNCNIYDLNAKFQSNIPNNKKVIWEKYVILHENDKVRKYVKNASFFVDRSGTKNNNTC